MTKRGYDEHILGSSVWDFTTQDSGYSRTTPQRLPAMPICVHCGTPKPDDDGMTIYIQCGFCERPLCDNCRSDRVHEGRCRGYVAEDGLPIQSLSLDPQKTLAKHMATVATIKVTVGTKPKEIWRFRVGKPVDFEGLQCTHLQFVSAQDTIAHSSVPTPHVNVSITSGTARHTMSE